MDLKKNFNEEELLQLKKLKLDLDDINKVQILKRTRKLIAINTPSVSERSKGQITCERMTKIKLLNKLEVLIIKEQSKNSIKV